MIGYRPNEPYVHPPYKRRLVPSYRETKKPPKEQSESVIVRTSVDSHNDLINALNAIALGVMNPCQFRTRDGVNRMRLETVQSLRDSGASYNTREIARFGYVDLLRVRNRKLR